jgi:hypothetical protein
MLMDRTAAASMVASIAVERARNALRYDRGLSYGVGSTWEPLTRDVALCAFWCDCREGDERTAALLLRSTLEELAADGPTEAELHNEISERTHRAGDRSNIAEFASYAAAAHIFGRAHQTVAELVTDDEEVTSPVAADTLNEGIKSALLLTGVANWPRGDSWSLYPMYSEERVGGRRYRPSGAARISKKGPMLFADTTGVSAITENNDAATVKFDECEVLERCADGTRVLWGHDATHLAINPRAWREGASLVAYVDEHVAPERAISTNPAVEARVAELIASIRTRSLQARAFRVRLEAAAALLGFEEVPVAACQASWAGHGSGLLLLTQRRLVFYNAGRLHLDLPLHGISTAQLRGSRRLRRRRLVIKTEDGPLLFRDIFPSRSAPDFVDALRRELEAAGADAVVLDPPSLRERLYSTAAVAALPISFLLLFPEAPLDEGPPYESHARLIAFTAALLLFNAGSCALGVWCGLVGRRRAQEAGERSRGAIYGIVLSSLGVMLWLGLAVAGLVTSW